MYRLLVFTSRNNNDFPDPQWPGKQQTGRYIDENVNNYREALISKVNFMFSVLSWILNFLCFHSMYCFWNEKFWSFICLLKAVISLSHETKWATPQTSCCLHHLEIAVTAAWCLQLCVWFVSNVLKLRPLEGNLPPGSQTLITHKWFRTQHYPRKNLFTACPGMFARTLWFSPPAMVAHLRSYLLLPGAGRFGIACL